MAEPRHRPSKEGKCSYFGQYITHEGSKRLLKYEYHGGDHSYIYKHFLTPMNNYLIQYIPYCIAPNVITLLGLLLVASTHIAVNVYSPNMIGNEIPTWLLWSSALALFAYQTLDNLDGKQARRTGTSSPLGLLFDHGCDAINVTIGCCTLSAVVQFGPTMHLLLFCIAGNLAFVAATWEEYYTGALELPMVNGPTDGVLLAVAVKMVTAIYGQDIWTTPTRFFDFPLNELFFYIVTFTALCTLFLNVSNVWMAVRQYDDRMTVAVTRLLPFLILDALALAWVYWSPTDILALHPRLFVWTLGLLHSKLVLHLMLAHLCGEEYHPFRKTLVPIFYVAGHWIFTSFAHGSDVVSVSETVVLQEFFLVALLSYGHLVVSVILEVSTVLNVPIFTVPKKMQKKQE